MHKQILKVGVRENRSFDLLLETITRVDKPKDCLSCAMLKQQGVHTQI